MRLDKFLKVSRLIKRRTVAKEVADQNRIKINNKEAKAGTTVKPGDTLTIQFGGNRTLVAQINHIAVTAKKEEATEMYTILKNEVTEQEL